MNKASRSDAAPGTFALWNHFTRYTFVSKTSPERLTMDLGLRYTDPNGEGDLGGIVIAELKQERADRSSHFVEIMRAMGQRPAGMSKYCVGMLTLQRPVKHNAFKAVLLKLAASSQGRLIIAPCTSSSACRSSTPTCGSCFSSSA